MTIHAPWTDEQVEALNRWQQCEFVHEFTCPNHHEGSRTLVAGTAGWKCPSCGYSQLWAHDFMLHLPVDPFAHLTGW